MRDAFAPVRGDCSDLELREDAINASQSRTAIILLNWNGWRDTLACLESLMEIDDGEIGIFVCDNGSTDSSIAEIRSWSETGLKAANEKRRAAQRPTYRFSDVTAIRPGGREAITDPDGAVGAITLIQTGSNAGFAAGNNVGIRHALADGFAFFWLLNNDTEVEPDSLSWLKRRMAEDPTIGICGSTLIYFDRRDRVQCWGGAHFQPIRAWSMPLGADSSPTQPIDRDAVEAALTYVSGASMLVSRAFLEKVGLMQEDYFLYWEEIDWAMRGKGSFRLGYAPQSIVYHKVGASIGTNDFGTSSPFSDYYMVRSQLKFCARFSRISLPGALFHVSRKILRCVRQGDWQRAALLLRAVFGLHYAEPS